MSQPEAVVLRRGGPAAAAEEASVSVVVPVSGHRDDLASIYRSFAAELNSMDREYEFLFIIDGGGEEAIRELKSLDDERDRVRAFAFGTSFGMAAALRAGIEQSKGNVVVTVPCWYHVVPEGIRAVLEELDRGADMVVGYRWPRTDGWVNRLQTRMFQRAVRAVAGFRFHDVGCSLRAMRREVAVSIPLYSGLHRFIPALASIEGFRIKEIPVAQHPAEAGKRVYSPGAYFRQALDLTALYFITRFTDKPLRFFGLIGVVMSIAGVAIGTVLAVQRLGGQGIANRPMLLLSVLLVAIGVQTIGLGLVGEMIVFLRRPSQRGYRVQRVV